MSENSEYECCYDCSQTSGFFSMKGNGKCGHCHGSGEEPSDNIILEIVDAFKGGPAECQECYGTGQCQTCGGTGRIKVD